MPRSRRAFGASLKSGGNRKTNNHPRALAAKVQIRENVLQAIGGGAAVFDAFAGEGQLYRAVWARAAGYVGCDLTWYRDRRLLYVADSRRVMRAIDLAPFNIFDFDAWGSPWEHVAILCARRPIAPREQIGLVLTDGSALKVKLGKLPLGLSYMAGMKMTMPGAMRGPRRDRRAGDRRDLPAPQLPCRAPLGGAGTGGDPDALPGARAGWRRSGISATRRRRGAQRHEPFQRRPSRLLKNGPTRPS